MINIYVDGSSLNNGNKNSKGGYAVVILNENNTVLLDAYCEYFEGVTNNQMQLKAFLKAFEIITTKYKDKQINIYSDSAYSINLITNWMHTWSNNNWHTSKGQKVKNLNIVLSLYKYYTKNFLIRQVNFKKVKGHSGNIGNELADALTRADKLKFSNEILKNHIYIDI